MQNLFNELCTELEILRGRENELITQAEIAQKQCYNSRIDRNTYIPLDTALYNFDGAMERLEALRAQIASKLEMMSNIERLIMSKELSHQVAYMRDIERLTLVEIAKRTNYNYSYIRHVSRKVPRLKIAQ